MDKIYLWENAPVNSYARQRLLLAAEHGNPEAATALGYFHSLGLHGYEHNLTLGKRYFDDGMARRYPQSFYVYGLVLLKIEPVDYHKALKFFERSANLGFGRGMAKVGEFFLNGRALTVNYKLAEEWLVKSRCRDAQKGLLLLASYYEEELFDADHAIELRTLAQSYIDNP
ncbi:MAG: hypothetical protein WCX47_02415 [Bacilli bacterium]|jgi:TPR repeat protein|nr:hypothetical protein [Bacilli bacterium]MDD3389174.1 hypothetical protein [Bacilli bacterium]MDD4344985.1 hypothetical protein [Bacilli bacterium]MDD4521162.1 hypothetical protein [Bacilli bacterium]MDY0399929.1 hypothetical protein [Bacilli bacterium]